MSLRVAGVVLVSFAMAGCESNPSGPSAPNVPSAPSASGASSGETSKPKAPEPGGRKKKAGASPTGAAD
jgi:hypothetical protein